MRMRQGIGMKLLRLLIGAGIIEIVTEHKYLGTDIDNRLNWNINTHKLCSKANQRIYFLRKLKLFNIDIMMSYQSVIQSVVLEYCMAK